MTGYKPHSQVSSKYAVVLRSIWSDNFSSLREQSLGEPMRGTFKVAMANLDGEQTEMQFKTHLSYNKSRNYVERKVKSIKKPLNQLHPHSKEYQKMILDE